MRLSDYISREDILTGFEAPDKAGALEKLCCFAAERRGLSGASLLRVVMEREAMGSTGIGSKVALPHGKSPDVTRPLLVLAVSAKGVDFDSLDLNPVQLFVLLITPAKGGAWEHLQILARLGGMFKSEESVRDFLEAESPKEIFELILRRE